MRWLNRIRPTKLITCASCGTAHRIEDLRLTFGHADLLSEISENSRATGWYEDTDFARLEKQRFFIRCLLEIPVLHRRRQPFAFGVWAEVSQSEFSRYREVFLSIYQGREAPLEGNLANEISLYGQETRGLPLEIHLRNDRVRPYAIVRAPQHPLAVEQSQGITVERVLEIHHTLMP